MQELYLEQQLLSNLILLPLLIDFTLFNKYLHKKKRCEATVTDNKGIALIPIIKSKLILFAASLI